MCFKGKMLIMCYHKCLMSINLVYFNHRKQSEKWEPFYQQNSVKTLFKFKPTEKLYIRSDKNVIYVFNRIQYNCLKRVWRETISA